jgi:heme oxygenase
MKIKKEKKSMQNLVAESDVMAVLKASTAEQHRAVENLMPFFREQFSLEDYTRTLAAFLGFFEPVEQSLRYAADWSAVGIDIDDRSRAHLLRGDLRALGLSVSAIESLPRTSSLPPMGNLESALGCLYVLEGSTLGGQVIGRELARRFGIDASTGASFFLSHGPRVGDMWREFCSALRKHAHRPSSQQLAVDAAIQTYASLEDWMQKRAIDA